MRATFTLLLCLAATPSLARPALSLSLRDGPPQTPPTAPLDPGPAGSSPAAEKAPAAPAEAIAQAQPGDNDFDLLPKEKAPDAAVLAREDRVTRQLALRRKMLVLHQLGGFATLAGLAATVVIGQLNYADKYGGGSDTGRYLKLHQYTALSTSAVFAATGLLAVFAPSPTEKPLRLDTGTLHKVSMGVATAGMIAEIVLGIWTASKESTGKNPDLALTQRNLARAHQVIGYTTLVATAAGFTVFAF